MIERRFFLNIILCNEFFSSYFCTFSSIRNRFSARDTRATNFRPLDYNLTEIDSNIGLYFEKSANLQICTKHATFVFHTNLTYFVNEEKYFEYTVSELQKMCNKICENSTILNSNCSITMEILHASLNEIKEYSIQNHMVWFHNKNLKNLHRRKKRDLSSTFAKLLFGSSSSSSDENAAIQINMLKLQTVENLLLIDKHKTVIDALLNVVNNTVQFQSGLHAKLQNSFDNLTEWLNHTTNKTAAAIQSQEMYAKFIELSFVVMFSILEFRENQRKLFDAISMKSTIFQLISPKVFEMKLREVKDSDGDAQLPMALTTKNLPKFYEITTIEREIVNDTFVCRFSVPLVDTETFDLYKAITVPYRSATNDTGTEYSFIVPRYEFIALDASNATYLTWTANDLKRCHHLNGTNLMCYLNSPINMAKNSIGCEINLLLGRNSSKNCEIHRDLIDEFWVKLDQPNTYLYALPNIMPVVIQCPQSNTSIFLQNTGLISLKSGCRIKTNRIELITFHSIEANISHNLMQPASPKIDVSSEIANVTQINLTPILIVSLPNNSNSDDWIKVEEIKHNLQMDIGIAIDAAEKVLNTVVNSSQSNEIILSLAAIIIAIAVIYTCIKYSLTTGICILLFVILVCLTTSIVHYFA